MTFRPIDIPEAPRHALADQAAPMLQWVALADLVIDGRYQRDITGLGRANMARIARDFRWSRFSPLLVAPVEGGRFAIIDGQHRAHAAALCGVDAVPCMAVLMDLTEQATAFRHINGQVTKVDQLQLYRAALAAGEGWAVECDRVVREGGARLMTSKVSSWDRKPGQITALTMVRRHVAQGTGNVVTAALRAITDSECSDDPGLYGHKVLAPFCGAIARSTRFLRCDLRAFVEIHDLTALRNEAEEYAKVTPGGARFGPLLEDMIAARLQKFSSGEAA